MTTGLSGSVNISVTYLAIRQDVSHDTLNRLLCLKRVSYHVPPEYRSVTTTPQIVTQTCTYWRLSSVNIINHVSEICGFHGGECKGNCLLLRQQILLKHRYLPEHTVSSSRRQLVTFIVMPVSFYLILAAAASRAPTLIDLGSYYSSSSYSSP